MATTVQDKLDKNVEFVCSSFNARFDKSKAVQNESLYHVTYTITCEDGHTIIFHANCFPSMFGMVINDLFSENESSMIVETLESEDDYIEKIVSTLSDLMTCKKSENKDEDQDLDNGSVDEYDLVSDVVCATLNTTWEHKYGDDDVKGTSFDNFIFNINYDVMMTVTLEYWNKDRDNNDKIDILTFTARTMSGTYEKKIINTTMSEAMRESIDFINGADKWCYGRMTK
jgi:hypothetical protein